MAAPTDYNRTYNFTNLQAVDPSSPLNGSYIEVEFNNVKATLDSIINNLGLIQRDDTALANTSVGLDQLKDELNGFGFNPPAQWATDTNYVVNDTTFANSAFYRCLVSHVSDVFLTDLASEYWELIADFSAEVALGAMLQSTYDPGGVEDDVFDMANMVEAANAKVMTSAERTKVGYLTVTGSVDLDSINTRVNDLDAAVVLRGSWDASSGSFPGSGSAQAGDSYIVSTGGTVDSEVFVAGDRIVAITDNASTSTYASNWLKLDYTDQVSSVAGKTGAVTLAASDIASGEFGTSLIADNAITLAKLEDGTQGDILYYGASGAPSRLSAGTAGQVLVMNSGATAPEWGDAGLVLVSEGEPTSDTNEIVATGLSAYRDVEVWFTVEVTNSAGVDPILRARASGGTWRTLATLPLSTGSVGFFGRAIIRNFGKSNDIKMVDVKHYYAAGIDRSDAIDIAAVVQDLIGPVTFNERWDEIGLYANTNSFEGSTADARSYVAFYGVGAGG